jgi:uncharacterized protein YjbI with pentapeptide repeats
MDNQIQLNNGNDYSGQDLTAHHYKEVDIKNVNFSFANLSESSFENATFENVNFTNANLSNAHLKNCYIFNCTFTDVNLSGAIFGNDSRIENSNFERAILTNAIIDQCYIKNCIFNNANFINASISLTSILISQFNHSSFDTARLYKDIFINLNFNNSTINKVGSIDTMLIRGCTFNNVVMEPLQNDATNFIDAIQLNNRNGMILNSFNRAMPTSPFEIKMFIRDNDGYALDGYSEDDEDIDNEDMNNEVMMNNENMMNDEDMMNNEDEMFNLDMDEDEMFNLEHAQDIHREANVFNPIKTRFIEILENAFPNAPDITMQQIGDLMVKHVNEDTSGEFDYKPEIIRQINAVITRGNINMREVYGNNSETPKLIKYSMTYLFTLPKDIITYYIKAFANDCYMAYNAAEGEGISCAAGIHERIYLTMRDVILILSSMEEKCDETCIELAKLLNLEPFNIKTTIVQEWRKQVVNSTTLPKEIRNRFQANDEDTTYDFQYNFTSEQLIILEKDFSMFASKRYKEMYNVNEVPDVVLLQIKNFVENDFRLLLTDTLIGGKRKKTKMTKKKLSQIKTKMTKKKLSQIKTKMTKKKLSQIKTKMTKKKLSQIKKKRTIKKLLTKKKNNKHKQRKYKKRTTRRK